MTQRLSPAMKVPAEQIQVPSLVLAAAFQDDPLFAAAIPNPVRRASALPLCWQACARQATRKGWVDTVERDGRVVGAAVWLPGEDAEVGWRDVFRDRHAQMVLACGVDDCLRLMRIQAEMSRAHHRLVHRRHNYLFGVGVLPGQQGTGVGTELVQRGLERTRSQGRTAYLETNLSQNVRLYERLGFTTLDEQDQHGFHTWFMEHPLGA